MDPDIENLIENYQEAEEIEMTESFLESYVEFASTEILEILKVSLVGISETWIEMGLPEPEREKLHHVFADSISDYVKKFQDDQKDKLKGLYSYREYSLIEINKILSDLSLPEHKYDAEKPLLSQCKMLKIKKAEMENVKSERLSQLNSIVQKWKKIRAYLGEEWEDPKFQTDIPAEFELVMVRSNMVKQEELYKRRKAQFLQLKKEINDFAKKIEYEFSEDESFMNTEDVIYSVDIMKDIESLKAKLEKEHKQILATNESKIEKLQRLFDRLKIEDHVRNAILHSQHSSLVQQGKYFDSEIEKYEIIKLGMIKDITLDVREKVYELLAQCRSSKFPLPDFFESNDDFTEPQLILHEKFLEHLQNYHEAFSPIFQQLENYEDIMNKALELEVKIHDPNKYKNRGGALLTNERDHRIAKKRLETMEREIIANTLKSEGISFSQYGFDIHAYFSDKHIEYEDGVESIKAAYGKSKTNSKERIQVVSSTKKIAPVARTPLKAKMMTNSVPKKQPEKKADYCEIAFKRDLLNLDSEKNNLQSTVIETPIFADFARIPRIALPNVHSRTKRRISRSVEREVPSSKKALFRDDNQDKFRRRR